MGTLVGGRYFGDVRCPLPSTRIPHPMVGQPPLDTTVSDIVVPLSAGTVHVWRSRVLKFTDPILSFDGSR